jgi:hypothetical protein
MNWTLLSIVAVVIVFALIILPLIISRKAEKEDQD